MSEQKRAHLEEFISLSWYEDFLRFVANFIAKSSEILLTAGLVVSSANFLSDGSMLKDGTPFAIAWAWTQAIAIDGSLGVSFYSVFQSLKQRDWIKCVLYSILTLLLTLVAWYITEGDILSHAINASSHDAMQLIGIDIRILSTLRAIAVVGFVLMSRLRDVTLWECQQKVKASQISNAQNASSHDKQQAILPENEVNPLSELDIEQLIQNMLQKHGYSIATMRDDNGGVSEPQTTISQALPERASNTDVSQKSNQEQRTSHRLPQEENLAQSSIQNSPQQQETTIGRESEAGTEPLTREDDILIGQEDRLQQAYQELKEEGQRISGKTLAQRAHVRRATCLEWLRIHQQNTHNSLSE